VQLVGSGMPGQMPMLDASAVGVVVAVVVILLVVLFAAKEEHDEQFVHEVFGARGPKKRQSGSGGVWVALLLYVNEVAPWTRGIRSQHSSMEGHSCAKPTM
jgi:hypothetical protein